MDSHQCARFDFIAVISVIPILNCLTCFLEHMVLSGVDYLYTQITIILHF
jgi:hypothetical protein